MELFKLFGTIAINNGAANNAIDETTGIAEKSEGRMSSAFKKIGAAVAAAFAVDKIIAFGKSITDAAATVAAEQSAFEQIMGDYSDTAQQKVNEIADTTGMVATRLTPYMTSMTAKFKGLGYDIDDATTLAQGGLTLAADAAAFWDKSLQDSMSALNSFVNGSYEGGEAIGLFANDTQMAQYAIKQGLVETTAAWSSLDEATKQATRLEYAQAMFEASGAVGQAAKESGQYANIQANLTEKWRQFKAQIGEPLLQNVVIPAMDKLSSVVDTVSQKFQQLQQWVSDNKSQLESLGSTLETVAGIVGVAAAAFVGLKAGMMIQSAVQGFQSAQVAISLLSMEIGGANLAQAALNGTMTIGQTIVALLTGKMTLASLAQAAMVKGQALLNAVMAANPIALVIMAIVALVAAFVLLWNKSEAFRNFWIGLWNGIKSLTASVIEGIKTFFTGLWEHIQTVWDAIVNAVQFAIMLIGSIMSAAFQIITLPFRFIWENCKQYVFAAWEWIKNAISTALTAIRNVISTVWNAIYTVLSPILNKIKSVVSTVWNAIKTVITTVVNAIKSVVTSVWNSISSTVSGVVNGIKSTVSSVFNSIKSVVTSVWNSIKSAIETPIKNAANTVKTQVDKIKGFFDNLKIKFPDIKLPHFNLTGKFGFDPPSVPKLSIDWYAKAMNNAMLLNSPTIFGMNPAGQLMGGGEAGQEVVSGSKTLMGMIRDAVNAENSGLTYYLDRLISMLAEYFPEILANMGNDIVLNDGVLVGRLAPKMDSTLGDINELRKRGR